MTKKRLKTLLQMPCQIIDVRSISEFDSAHDPKSINIPLDTIKQQMDLIQKDIPIILVCKSGTRSGMAKMALKSMNFTNVTNGGAWQNLQDS